MSMIQIETDEFVLAGFIERSFLAREQIEIAGRSFILNNMRRDFQCGTVTVHGTHVKTPEQIAADERGAAIERMMHTIERYDNEARLHCGMLYDALYRKTERTTGAE